MNGKQLKAIIERSGIRTNAFAERMGIVPQSLNSIFNSADVKSGTLDAAKVNKFLPDNITTYYARHTWATIAAALDVPDDVISQALGHAARNSTTAIYIERSQRKVDEANRRVIDFVLGG